MNARAVPPGPLFAPGEWVTQHRGNGSPRTGRVIVCVAPDHAWQLALRPPRAKVQWTSDAIKRQREVAWYDTRKLRLATPEEVAAAGAWEQRSQIVVIRPRTRTAVKPKRVEPESKEGNGT